MKKIIKKITQSYANFIIDKLKDCKSDKEFEMWYTQGLYLDLWCELRGIELE